MQILLGRCSSRMKNNKIKTILTGDTIFTLPDLTATEIYAPEKSIEANEWFRLEQYSTKSYTNLIIDEFSDTTNYAPITSNFYSNLEYLCCISEGNYIFQKISKNNLISKRWIGLFGDFIIEQNKPILILGEYIDAVYDKPNDVLYFKNLSHVTSIFEGIDQLYKEATTAEVQGFLTSSFITLKSDFNSNKVKTANRKRIALAKTTFENFDELQKIEVLEYIHKYCPNLTLSSSSFSIGDENELKALLYGIEQRYYQKPITKENVVANAIEPI